MEGVVFRPVWACAAPGVGVEALRVGLARRWALAGEDGGGLGRRGPACGLGLWGIKRGLRLVVAPRWGCGGAGQFTETPLGDRVGKGVP